MKEKRSTPGFEKTPDLEYNKNYKDRFRANVERQLAEKERNSQLRGNARLTPGYRENEQAADTSRRAERRTDPEYRRLEQIANT